MPVLEIAPTLKEAKSVFRKRWAEQVKQHGYDLEVASFDTAVRRRHQALWENLVEAFQTDQFDPYLALVAQESRLQARACSRLEPLLTQLSQLLSLAWDIISSTPLIDSEPVRLLEVTRKVNWLRVQAESALITAYLDEQSLIEQEQAKESDARRHSRLRQMSLQDLIKSISSFKIVRYQPSQLIFQPGDSPANLYFVMSGQVRLYELLPDGRCVSLSILKTGDVFSHSKNRGHYYHDVYAEVMSASSVALINESTLEQLMSDNPVLASCVVQSLSEQLSQTQFLIEGLIGRDVSLRLVTILLKLATEFGEVQQEGVVSIGLDLTHQGLADMIGSNRVTVTRKIAELQQKKLLKMERGKVVLLNHPALESLVA